MTTSLSRPVVNDLVRVGLNQRARVVAADATHLSVLILEDAYLSEFARGTCWAFHRQDVEPARQLQLEVA